MNIQMLEDDLKKAMKNGDKFELSVLRMLKSSLQNEKISKGHYLEENEIIATIKKQVKVRKDSIKEYEEYNRNDLADNLKKEVDILSKYLPEELSDEEINKIIDSVFETVKPTGMKDMGNIMKELNEKLAVCADMSLVSKIVRDKLNQL